jgi:hypothetical protein
MESSPSGCAANLDHVISAFGIVAGVAVEHGIRESELRTTRLAQFTHPDVAEPDGVAVVLEGDGLFFGVSAVGGRSEPGGWAGQFDIVLDEHAVVERGDPGRGEQVAFGIEPGAV